MDLIYFTIIVSALVIIALGIIGLIIELKNKANKDTQLINIMTDKNALASYGIAQAQARMQAEKELDQRIKELSEQQKALRELKKYI